ncbi:hypothetical protein ACFX11_000026 [Malus domestica]
MAPATTSSAAAAAAPAHLFIRFNRRTSAPRQPSPPGSPPKKKMKSMAEIMAKAKFTVVERGDYGDVTCEHCGSGDRSDELLLCDKCDRGFHMKCLRPIVAIVPIGSWLCPACSGHRRVRSFSQKKIVDFFRIQKCSDRYPKDECASPQGKFRYIIWYSMAIVVFVVAIPIGFRFVIIIFVNDVQSFMTIKDKGRHWIHNVSMIGSSKLECEDTMKIVNEIEFRVE